METTKQNLVASIVDMICLAVENAKSDNSFSLTDMYVTYKLDEQTLSFFDDAENLLCQNSLELPVDDNEEVVTIKSLLQLALDDKTVEEALESLDYVAPISVILMSDEGDVVCELKTFHSDIMVLEDDFLKKMGDELDEFFENLMADVK